MMKAIDMKIKEHEVGRSDSKNRQVRQSVLGCGAAKGPSLNGWTDRAPACQERQGKQRQNSLARQRDLTLGRVVWRISWLRARRGEAGRLPVSLIFDLRDCSLDRVPSTTVNTHK